MRSYNTLNKLFPIILSILLSSFVITFYNCSKKNSPSNTKNIQDYIKESYAKATVLGNGFCPEPYVTYYDSVLRLNLTPEQKLPCLFELGVNLMAAGYDERSAQAFESALSLIKNPYDSNSIVISRKLALANIRIGERENCVKNHTRESCIMPIQGTGVHINQSGSRKAIKILEEILTRFPKDYDSRWLLNIAYMTVGDYPTKVPAKWLIPNLDKDPQESNIKPFYNIGPMIGMHDKNISGGTILEDFNRDGFLDIMTSEWGAKGKMHYYLSNGTSGFVDATEKAGLSNIVGGLNMMQTDYDNDGDFDVFILRGAWYGVYGQIPNSLLRYNSDGTFTDVTLEAGLLSFKPTQTATWSDFNNDGYLDLFIGNESSEPFNNNSCELFINSKEGIFKEMSKEAGCQIFQFVKGVTAGDYNNDGLQDLYLSTLRGANKLLKNTGVQNGVPKFVDVTQQAGLDDIKLWTFPTWFWDYNNDGWLDIFVSGYSFGKSIAHTSCTDALHIPNTGSKTYLYRNDKNGKFTNVSLEAGLNTSIYSMGANFGDINNDGYLDMYLSTGNPDFESIVPNKLLVNRNGLKFEDVTVAARVGILQKGHAIGISDLDNDGDQDIFAEIGGALSGDYFYNSLFLNPGQNDNNWIHVRLKGKETNAAAIGSRIQLIFNDNGNRREIHRMICSGGSFGSSSLRNDIGLGKTSKIDSLIVNWQRTGKTQVLTNLEINKSIEITEGNSNVKFLNEKAITFAGDSTKIPMCKVL